MPRSLVCSEICIRDSSLMLAAGCGASGGTATNAEEPPAQEETSAVDEEQAEGPPAPRFATGAVTGLSPVTTLYVEAGPKSVELMPGGGRIFVNDLYAHKSFIFDADTYACLLYTSPSPRDS